MVSEDPIATTASGGYRGVSVGGVDVWRGIAYAQPPVDDLRWRRARPIPAHDGIVDAVGFSAVCPQAPMPAVPLGDNVTFSEDCLYLNVWTPPGASADGSSYPVMVWLHGGAYVFGSASQPIYDATRMVDEGSVVVVTLNYRLGAFGFADFTSVDAERFDTNAALSDVLVALGWVRDHIASFGGDPGNVTVFGESAGGGLVTTLLAMPAAEGLFHRAIAQSSPATSVYEQGRADFVAQRVIAALRSPASATDPTSSSTPVAGTVDGGTDAPVTDVDAAGVANTAAANTDPANTDPADTDPAATDLELLIGAGSDDVVAAAMVAFAEVPAEKPGIIAFTPIVDGDLVPQHPVDAFVAGESLRVPLLIGTNKDEASLFKWMKSPLMPISPADIERMFAGLGDDHPEITLPARAQISSAYSGMRPKVAGLGVARDVAFRMPTLWVAEGHSKHSPVYLYRFDWATRMLRALRIGATHATELPYVWGNLVSGSRDITFLLGGKKTGQDVSRRMLARWTRFAHTNRPDADDDDPAWPEFTTTRRASLVIDASDRIVDDLDAGLRATWGDQAIGFR